jgi:hypothetical protein
MPLKIRPSRMIMTFGPGSILDLPERESLMILDPALWPAHRHIYERRLAALVHVDHFGEPLWTPRGRGGRGEGLPAVDFPRIRYCPDCKLLQRGLTCTNHPGDPKPPRTMGPRLVAACPSGHIEDFPWKKWIKCKCRPGTERLFLLGGGAGYESDLLLRCETCGESKDLQGATGWLDWAVCSGLRPWRQDEEPCHNKLRGLMRGASNVYFPATRSSLSIPPFSKPLHKFLDAFRDAARDNWEAGSLREWVNVTIRVRKKIDDGTYTMEEILKGFEELYGGSRVVRVKDDEYPALSLPIPPTPGDDFRAHRMDIHDTTLEKWFESITVVSLLREVMALRGFTRIKSEGESIEGPPPARSPLDVRLQSWGTVTPSLGVADSLTQGDWMPGVELYGEGIFFRFPVKQITAWAKLNEKRTHGILSSPRKPPARAEIDTLDSRLILVHTFSHLMIREIALSCGYSIASLRERLYVSRGLGGEPEMCGTLIYTSSTDSEGTLGGLIEQARDASTLVTHLDRMLETSRICSQDPLCASHDPLPTHDPWGASCHACTQLPETSCETLQNRLLDRLSVAAPASGYFM